MRGNDLGFAKRRVVVGANEKSIEDMGGFSSSRVASGEDTPEGTESRFPSIDDGKYTRNVARARHMAAADCTRGFTFNHVHRKSAVSYP